MLAWGHRLIDIAKNRGVSLRTLKRYLKDNPINEKEIEKQYFKIRKDINYNFEIKKNTKEEVYKILDQYKDKLTGWINVINRNITAICKVININRIYFYDYIKVKKIDLKNLWNR